MRTLSQGSDGNDMDPDLGQLRLEYNRGVTSEVMEEELGPLMESRGERSDQSHEGWCLAGAGRMGGTIPASEPCPPITARAGV